MRSAPAQHPWVSQSVVCLLLIALSWPGKPGGGVTAAPPAKPKLFQSTAAALNPASDLPDGFSEEVVLTGVPFITTFDWAPDGRMFLALRDGRVWIYENGALLPGDFIDLSAQVNTFGDRGLLGMALDPNFAVTPDVYLLFNYDPPDLPNTNEHDMPDGSGHRVIRLVRVSADPENPNQALPGSEVVLLGSNSVLENIAGVDELAFDDWPFGPSSCLASGEPIRDCVPDDSSTHSVGALRFAPDGSLFVALGDASSPNAGTPNGPDLRAMRAQNLEVLAGKILRINPSTGAGYPDNPFYDGEVDSNRSKVVNYGMRNPFRYVFHPVTGELLIGDVGGTYWEEVNVGQGHNFGWPCYEGLSTNYHFASHAETAAACAPVYAQVESLTPPVYTYPNPGGAAIVAGPVYTGTVYPTAYAGLMFVGDVNARWIKTLDLEAPTPILTDFMVLDPGNYPIEIREGPDGNLYYAVLNYPNNGQVLRLRYTAGGNTPPTARLNATPDNGGLPLEVAFSGLASSDPDDEPLTYAWNFGDGTLGTGITSTHTYTVAATYTAVLTVTDSLSATSSAQVLIYAGNYRPMADLLTPVTGTQFTIGSTIEFSGTAADVEDGTLTDDSLAWLLILHHNQHIHPNGLPPTTGASGSFAATDHGDNTWFELCLTATDSGGLTDTVCRQVLPEAALYSFRSMPSGLQLIYDGAVRTTPFDVAVTVNAQRQLIAPEVQGSYVFDGWPDLLSSTLPFTATVPGQIITATYTLLPNLTWLPLIQQ